MSNNKAYVKLHLLPIRGANAIKQFACSSWLPDSIYTQNHDTSTEEFDPVLNRDQLVDTMYKLFELYAREATDCSNRAEFESYYILYNLGVEHIKMEITLKAMQFSESPIFQHSLLICKAAWLKNYVRFFRMDYSLAEEFSTVHGFQVSSDQLIFTKKSLVTSQDRRFGTILSAKIDSNIGAIIAPS
ncbi:uncharacterized protein TRIADDRAFT_52333 [Trichoplax adhaerens]|uniref:SAC3/GANP/THP3 conserved domain-containing protein n=1 Tax=Trichoplax adhaerens TaxID=10228 RepID=B3RI01_TRIAD|nr:predicted protein [Trichoplax adhaerens]EDV29679.1 predicted protein [Trichoplax adhaerens]|eukprot:XP_002108881.1 predicted protein [Trichoplax adhaerens]